MTTRQYRKFDEDFKQAVGDPDWQADRAGGPGAGCQRGHAGLVCKQRRSGEDGQAALSESERAELVRLRNAIIELRMQGMSSSVRWPYPPPG